MMYTAASFLVLIACACVESHPLSSEQLAMLSRTLESELSLASNELNSVYDDIPENEKEDLLKKYHMLERMKELSRGSDPSNELVEQPPEMISTAIRKDNSMQREIRRQQGPYMTLCHFKICNMGKKRSKQYPL